jgi:hypothetical protein
METIITKTKIESRNPLGSTTSDREEDDCPLLKKKSQLKHVIDTSAANDVCGMSNGSAHMYTCRLIAGCVHLRNFSKNEN